MGGGCLAFGALHSVIAFSEAFCDAGCGDPWAVRVIPVCFSIPIRYL